MATVARRPIEGTDRITVPVSADRRPAATTLVAVAVARQACLGVEFVDAAPQETRDVKAGELRHRCQSASEVGAASVSWRVLDGAPPDIGPYVTWSGAWLCCVGSSRHGRVRAYGASGVPMLVVGPSWRPGDGVTRRIVVGLHGPPAASGKVAAVAATLAARLGAELTMIEVVRSAWRPADVPACAHLHWVARDLHTPRTSFDTVAADRAADGLGRFLDRGTVVVVGAATHHRRALGGVAGRLVRRAPGPVLVVPA